MQMTTTSITLRPASLAVHLDAYWLRLYAGDYLSAAQQFSPPARRFSPVRHYLICHSIELSLKSFLFTAGLKRADRKKLNHDLEKALAAAEAHGIGRHVSVLDDDREQIIKVNSLYGGKEFEYFESLEMIFDPLPFDPVAIDSFAERLYAGIEEPVRASTIK
jgi:DNA primase catalytic subunit